MSLRRFGAWLRRSLLEQWLTPSDPRALALCRVALFWKVWPGFSGLGSTAFADFKDASFKPIGILAALHVPLLPNPLLELLDVVGSVAITGAMIGLFYAISAPIAAVSVLYTQWIAQSSGKINHGGLLIDWVLVMLAFTRAADAWSVDAWWRKRRGISRPLPSAEYRWPRAFMAVMLGSMYGAAGLSKLRVSGIDWGLGGNMRLLLLGHHFTREPLTHFGVWLADFPWICGALGFSSHLLELSGPLAIVHRYTYRLVLPGLALLQLGIWALLGLLFREVMVIFFCLLPWDFAILRGDAALRRFFSARTAASTGRTPDAAGARS
jgi:hypothetical protein